MLNGSTEPERVNKILNMKCGRVGPPDVILDIRSNVGTLIMEPDRLGVGYFNAYFRDHMLGFFFCMYLITFMIHMLTHSIREAPLREHKAP